MKALTSMLRQTGRRLGQTWGTQLMTLLTVSLSVLIFAFFLLIYNNMSTAGARLNDELRLIVYLAEEPVPAMLAQLESKIRDFDEVERIVFVSREEAFSRLGRQLGAAHDLLADFSPAILPPSLEIFPLKNLNSLTRIKRFADYLATLPGAVKVQYGHDWLERFHYFTQLLRIVVLLSAGLLLLTSTFMVSATVRLAVAARRKELEVLRLLGATNSYIRAPFLIEGLMHGIGGAGFGLLTLYFLFEWIKLKFSGPNFLNLLEFTFFPPATIGLILAAGIILCTGGSLVAIRRYLRI